MLSLSSFLVVLCVVGSAVAAPTQRAAAPTITLDSGVFTGAVSGNVNKFLGIPFAKRKLL